jgi:D-aminoacyl-tRNA deacylase
MIGLLQRVSRASVTVDGEEIAAIGRGILVLIGVERADGAAEVRRLGHRLTTYRVFADPSGKMNRSVLDIGGSVLLVPQFTLVADTRSGTRPGFSAGAEPAVGEALFAALIAECRRLGAPTQAGRFGADMQVSLINDGPVTFWLQVGG